MIVSGEQHKDSAIHIHVSILPQTPLPPRLPHNIEHRTTHSFRKLGKEGNFLKLVKNIYKTPATNIIHTKCFPPLRLGARQGCLLTPLLIQPSTESPSHLRKWNNRHTCGKGRGEISLFGDDMLVYISSVQFSRSVVSHSLWPHGFPVHHQLPEFTKTHVHWVGDAIQPSHPLSSPSPLALNLSQHQGLFQWVSSLHQVAKVLEFQLQHQSFQWIFRTDFL